jgi:thiol:disulfide interchange protein
VHLRSAVASAVLFALAACDTRPASPPKASPTPAAAAGKNADSWNPTEIAWRGYDEGLAEAKAQRRPILLVFFTSWCPHCANYSKVFGDPRVVEAAKQFVMIRLDGDKNGEVSARFAPDGEYVPRTFFVDPDGKLLADVHENRPRFRYFYEESRPNGLLAGMQAALAAAPR